MHSCDVPACVNPNHLSAGTHRDNMADMVVKGRASSLKGTSHNMAKLTEAQVVEIYHAEGPQKEIAATYGVNQSQISVIKTKKQWKHVHKDGDL